MSKTVVSLSSERVYNVIIAPVITEKTNMGSERNQITFLVAVNATKPEIKFSVEKLFHVRVQSVNTLLRKGKSKRFQGRYGKKRDVKRAIVTLKEGYSIDVTTGI